MKKTRKPKEVKPTTEIVEATPQPITEQESSVESFITQAISERVPVETLERLFSLRKEVKAEAAKEAFVTALASFQKDCPVIEKKKSVLNKDGTLRYKFAPIDSIVEQIKDAMAKNGLSYRWEVTAEANAITATAIITHSLGHSEKSSFTIPVEQARPDGKEFMTAPQRHASALTFAKRYSLCNALGIATGDEDTDATDAGKERDAKGPQAKIVFRLRTLGEKTATAEQCAEAVERLTKLKLAPENFEEIITRLDVVISERYAESENKEVR